jgi:phosphoglycolate phosphatase
MIQAILFDFNGVIINDEPLHMKAYQEALRAQGITLSEDDYFNSLGMDDETFVRAAFERAAQPLTAATMLDIIERQSELHRELIKDDLPLFAGVVTFIKAASRHFQLGLVSMSSRDQIDYALERAKLSDVFNIIVSAKDVSVCKPDPACYNRALELLNETRRAARQLPLLAHECLVIEDAPPGIQSGRAAGMRSLGVTNTVSEAQLRAAGADVVTHSLADWTVDAVHHVFEKH